MTPLQSQPLTPQMRRLLAALRRRIRLYVCLEGFSLAIIWLGVTFWLGLAIDYGLVRLGSAELPLAPRLVLLIVIAAVLAVILYRYIFRRAFVPLANHSMALLMERRFANFSDSLVTAVEMDEQRHADSHYQDDMVADILTKAQRELGQVRLRQIFNWKPLLLKLLGSALLIAITAAFFLQFPWAFNLWASRLYALDDRPWPRQAQIEVVNVKVSYGDPSDSESSSTTMQFGRDKTLKVARGSSVAITVRANANAPVVPRSCTLFYTNEAGERGRASMALTGGAPAGYQDYSYKDKPFRTIISDLTFDVLGHDHRLDDYSIEVVDGPDFSDIELVCTFPEYLVNEKLALWMPRVEPYRDGIQLPAGTHVTLRASTTKPIVTATIVDTVADDASPRPLRLNGTTAFELPLGALDDSNGILLDISLLDADGVTSRTPKRIFIAATKDRPPEIDVRLLGIGSAITPDARIPIVGTIADDYDIARAWTELFPSDGDLEDQPIALAAGGAVETVVDLRELRARQSRPLALEPKDKLTLTVKSVDRYNLGEAENLGSSDRKTLTVVTPDELLAMLETRELGLRQRFEQIIEEMSLTRDSLVRVQNELSGVANRGLEPEDLRPESNVPEADSGSDTEAPPADPTTEGADRETDSVNNSDPGDDSEPGEGESHEFRLRLLRVERALQQSQKSRQEVLGVAVSFADIRDELVNNRVDTQERKERLENQIAQPLQQIGDALFPQFDNQLKSLQKKITERDLDAVNMANTTVDEANELVAAMESVLQRMIDLESYNELVDILRGLLADQESLIEATKKEQAQDVLDLLK